MHALVIVLLAAFAAWASSAAPATAVGIESYRTLSGKTAFIEPEAPLTEAVVEGGYQAQACNCAMCVGLRATRRVVEVNAPTPLAELETALREISLTEDDVVYDLGSGDGRVAILAALEFGARTVGLDRRGAAVELAKANARRNGVEDLTRFYALDDARADLSAATVVYCYRRPVELTPIGLQLERLPRLRLSLSYRHTWPNGRSQRSGNFWLWRRRAEIASPQQPTLGVASEDGAATIQSGQTPRPVLRWFGGTCRGGACRTCR